VFTGLVTCTGEVVAVREVPQGRALSIRSDLAARDVAIGASVAVSGVCLTVTEHTGATVAFDAAFETLRLTTLGDLVVGATVNLEPSLRVGDPLGGHLVSGHVDGVASLRSATPRGDAREMWFEVPEPLRRFIAAKGSVAVDGVSLTVNAVDGTGFAVGLIPHTLAVTTFGALQPGSRVNLEVDVLARYVARLLESGEPGGITRQTLIDGGFME
jgi:riboflavin synthase